ncbi:toll/interleukin-1 receptor domain-containing protein [Amycolatopsis sp. CA-128772]|uniref:toll/interleukin-1 receptor domain-containing protein n=1 Tax=Amycolatopsis sp. CA-128772 TaxID=2073159 RepID=UPI00130490CF|nr:toll/interleukin-1 receptor domain-containing protein [Amycolatopsis sp. CA-128772]
MNDDHEARPTVFVAYLHESEDHRELVMRFAAFLRTCGIDARLDRWSFGGRQDWYRWALDLIPRSDYVVVVASPRCRTVGDGQGPPWDNMGGQAEMALLRELLQRDRATWTRKLLPVLLPGGTWEDIPLFLQGRTADHYRVDALTPEAAEDLLRVLTGQPPYPSPPLGPLITLPPRNGRSHLSEGHDTGNASAVTER